MIFRCTGLVVLLAVLAPSMRADATLRYHSDIQTTPLIPVAALDQALEGMRDMVVQLKGNKAHTSQGKFTSIMDVTTQDLILVDAPNKRFASIPSGQYAQQAKAALPAVPEEARAFLASMKTNFESHSTGRTAIIQGVQAEEQEYVLTVDMALPGGQAMPGPFMKMVMQAWTAKPGEEQRVPALQEFKNYMAIASFSMNSTAMLQQILSGLPGIGDSLSAMMEKIAKEGSTSLRTHMEIRMPILATLMQQVPLPPGQAPPAGLDPNAPLMQMTQELVELSSEPLDAALFEVPAEYRQTSMEVILKDAVAASTPPQFKK